MRIDFSKYHGAGNDFVMIDARKSRESLFTTELVRFLCDRHFGIGGDGLILLLESPGYDFHMKYFNSDGKEGTMCGNGGRCIVLFAHDLNIIGKKTEFEGIDGPHRAHISADNLIDLKMSDVEEVNKLEDGYFLNTGSPHLVLFIPKIKEIDVISGGRELRHQKRFAPQGSNINFVEKSDKILKIRTYERGVENETLACGTGCVAAAISSYMDGQTDTTQWDIQAAGGDLQVRFSRDNKGVFRDIWLKGPAKHVFSGSLKL